MHILINGCGNSCVGKLSHELLQKSAMKLHNFDLCLEVIIADQLFIAFLPAINKSHYYQ